MAQDKRQQTLIRANEMSDVDILECLGTCTPTDIKILSNRLNDLRARVARLNNVVDMIYQMRKITVDKEANLVACYNRYLEREKVNEIAERKS
jgi:hypothetical protein